MQTKQIFFKTDFQITEHSEAGYGVPFRFKYYTGAPSRAFIASFDGQNYTNCHLNDDGDLVIGFDDQKMGLGILKVERTYYLNDVNYASGVCDEWIAPTHVVIEELDDQGQVQKFQLQLALEGEATIEATSTVAPYWAVGPEGPQGQQGPQGPQGPAGGFLFPVMNFNPEDGVLTISGLEQEISRVRYDYATAELIIRLAN
jgi:hypothetical protein